MLENVDEFPELRGRPSLKEGLEKCCRWLSWKFCHIRALILILFRIYFLEFSSSMIKFKLLDVLQLYMINFKVLRWVRVRTVWLFKIEYNRNLNKNIKEKGNKKWCKYDLKYTWTNPFTRHSHGSMDGEQTLV